MDTAISDSTGRLQSVSINQSLRSNLSRPNTAHHAFNPFGQ